MSEYTAQSVKISDIKIIGNKNKIEDIEPLAESIKKIGLIFPILLDQDFNLLDGLRRIKAYQKLGFERIPAYVKQ